MRKLQLSAMRVTAHEQFDYPLGLGPGHPLRQSCIVELTQLQRHCYVGDAALQIGLRRNAYPACVAS